MAGPLARRSGVAIGLIAELLEWVPRSIYQVGIGLSHAETEVFFECWPDVVLFGAEPSPRITPALADPDDAAYYRGEIFRVAISDRAGKATFYQKNHHKDGSSLCNLEGIDGLDVFDVPVTTIDQLWPRGPIRLPALLWLDCEGSELAALRGAVDFLEYVDVVNVELTHKPHAPGWCSAVEVHEELLARGFLRQWIHTQRSSAGQIDGVYVRPKIFRPEYCCCPCSTERFECLAKSPT